MSSYADTWSFSNNCLIQGEVFSHFSLTHGKLFCMSCDKQIIPIFFSLSLPYSLSLSLSPSYMSSLFLVVALSLFLSLILFIPNSIYLLSLPPPSLYQNVFVLKIVIFLCHGLSQKWNHQDVGTNKKGFIFIVIFPLVWDMLSSSIQISANRGTDSRFVLELSLKSL